MTIWWVWFIIGIATGWLAAMGLWMWLTRPPKPTPGAPHRIEGTGILYQPDPKHHADHG